MSTGKHDIELDTKCSTCGGDLIIIPEHGMFPQHTDAELEANHQPTITGRQQSMNQQITEALIGLTNGEPEPRISQAVFSVGAACDHCEKEKATGIMVFHFAYDDSGDRTGFEIRAFCNKHGDFFARLVEGARYQLAQWFFFPEYDNTNDDIVRPA